MEKNYNILTVFTGGTIGSKINETTGLIGTSDDNSIISMFNESKKAEIEGEYDCNISFKSVSPYKILSENLNGDDLESLFDCIDGYIEPSPDGETKETPDTPDGIIVLTGSDTYAYVSAFLRLLFSDFKKTMVVICSNHPLDDERSNGLLHFSAAVEKIVSDAMNGASGIFAVYENEMKGAATFYDAGSLLLQPSFSDKVTGYIPEKKQKFNIVYTISDPSLPDQRARFKNRRRHLKDVNISFIRPFPGMRYPDPLSYDAIVLDTYHSGTLPTDERSGFERFIFDADSSGTLVIIAGVSKNAGTYDSMKAYKKGAITVLYDVAPVMAFIQTWVSLTL